MADEIRIGQNVTEIGSTQQDKSLFISQDILEVSHGFEISRIFVGQNMIEVGYIVLSFNTYGAMFI